MRSNVSYSFVGVVSTSQQNEVFYLTNADNKISKAEEAAFLAKADEENVEDTISKRRKTPVECLDAVWKNNVLKGKYIETTTKKLVQSFMKNANVPNLVDPADYRRVLAMSGLVKIGDAVVSELFLLNERLVTLAFDTVRAYVIDVVGDEEAQREKELTSTQKALVDIQAELDQLISKEQPTEADSKKIKKLLQSMTSLTDRISNL